MGGASSCDSLVAACMSSASHSSGDRLTQFDTRRSSIWPRRSRLVNNCSLHGSQASSRNNKASSSLFESNNTFSNPKQRRFNRASNSGIIIPNTATTLLVTMPLRFSLKQNSYLYWVNRASHYSRDGEGRNG